MATEKSKALVIGKPAEAQQELVQYDPAIQAMIEQAKGEVARETQDLNKDAGLPRINLKNADEEMDVVILNHQKSNAYWEAGFKPGDTSAPDCASDDGVFGFGKRLIGKDWVEGKQECDACPLNQFGSKGDDTRGKACRNMRILFIQNIAYKTPSPELLVIPPTGLKPIAQYLREMIQDGVMRFTVITKVRKIDDDRTPLGSFAFERGPMLTPNQMNFIAPIYRSFQAAKAAASQLRNDESAAPAQEINY
jgi:hypothetical protein